MQLSKPNKLSSIAPTSEDFLNKFNPEALQKRYPYKGYTKASDCNAPSLKEVELTYSTDIARIVIETHLVLVNEWLNLNVDKKLSDYQIREISRIVLKKYPLFNLAEISLFFDNLKAGDYGKLYGNLGADFIMDALKQYLKKRTQLLAKRGYA